MTVVTSYPGVYISEESLLSFSISGSSTAVPAFLISRTPAGSPKDIITRLNSWVDYRKIFSGDSWESDIFNVVHYWFSNGGGVCYLIDYEAVNEIANLDEVTLVVSNNFNKNLFSMIDSLTGPGKYRFVLLDGPEDEITSEESADSVMADYPVTPYAGVWYPWLKTDKGTIAIPPSVIAAIAIAKTDSTRGVWKTPANIVINGVNPCYSISDDLQGRFSQGKALNMIRTFPDLGTVVWGGRTLDDSDNWRYISVRRLFNMIERDIQKTLNKVMFEPNSQPTWQKVRFAVENYLYRLWQQDALLGNKAEEAYFVSIGKDITMTDDDIRQGKMLVKIGLAAVRPAEFILLQFSQTVSQ